MNIHLPKVDRKKNGQGLVEFALILPVLIMLIFGTIEFGRYLVAYVATATASREASRYGSAAGGNAAGLPRYQDCAGMRAAARKIGFLAGITDNDIDIQYDAGPGFTDDIPDDCGTTDLHGPSNIQLGDRVVVTVISHFEPIVPMFGLEGGLLDIQSITSRTIIRNIAVGPAQPPSPPPMPKVTFNTPDTSFDEPPSTSPVDYSVTVHLTEGPDHPVTIPVTVKATSTASGGADYTLATLAVSFAAYQQDVSFVVTIQPDLFDEEDETIILVLGTAAGIELGDTPEHTVTIVDNDGPPEVFFQTIVGQNVSENAMAAVVVQLSAESEKTVTVEFGATGGTADLLGADYTLLGAHPLEFTPHTTSASFIISGTVDMIYEGTETALISLLEPVENATIRTGYDTATIGIIDADSPPKVEFLLDKQSGSETSGIMPVIIRLIDPNTPGLEIISGVDTTVNYIVSGTATEGIGDDYTIDASPVVIPAGQSRATINVHVLQDLIPEGDETVIITMGTIINAEPGSIPEHILTISSKVVYFETPNSTTLNSKTLAEGVTTWTIRAEVNTAPTENAIHVPLYLSGTATRNSDYTISAPLELVFPIGATEALIDVTIRDDTLDEDDNETVILTMGDPDYASRADPFVYTINISDNENSPKVTFAISNQSKAEDNANPNMIVEVRLVDPSTGALTTSGRDIGVNFNVAGTATASGNYYDYTIDASPVIIPAGTSIVNLNITLRNDGWDEEDSESILIDLLTPTNASLGAITQHTVSIGDDDAMPKVGFNIASDSLTEANETKTVLAVLDAFSGRPVTVYYNIGGSAIRTGLDPDYSITASPVVIPAYTTSFPININVLDDGTLGEADETVALAMTTPTNATAFGITNYTLTIIDNDIVCPTAGQFFINANKLYFDVSNINLGSVIYYLMRIEINWPKDPNDQRLDDIYFGGSPTPLAYPAGAELPNDTDPSTVVVWTTTDALRTLLPNTTKRLDFEF
ncbi:MAG: hypothetical protein EHM70_01575, partial [Chloroflexota bacterium]